jgi:hypothetical protein
MSDLVKLVTSRTAALIWFNKEPLSSVLYADVDYLLNGLLTAYTKTSPDHQGRVLVGTNFGKQFTVFISNNPDKKELQSFVALVKKELTGEADIVVIDEIEGMAKFKNELQDISEKFRLLNIS